MTYQQCGLGDENAGFAVYIANRPPLEAYECLDYLRPMQAGEIATIAQQTGNHWRKVFNVFAKLVYAWGVEGFDNWQNYRDRKLLQADSGQALLFSRPNLEGSKRIHLITGRTYATELELGLPFDVIDEVFWVNREQRVIVCPYFDYRQLSNIKIIRLVELLRWVNGGQLHESQPHESRV